MNLEHLNNLAVENFRDYLRIPSVQPDPDYTECVTFLTKQAKELDVPINVYEYHPKRPVVVLTFTGSDPTMPAILLNSHMDVVPVYAEKWTYPPFDAYMDEDGNIFARGSQDMKCVGIQYLEAMRRLRLAGQKLKRTVHVSFVPDEEIGGVLGMKEFVESNDFKNLNVGFALDEGVANPTDNYYLFNGERAIWHVWVRCTGITGHGSALLDNTAGEKLRYVINKFMDLREKEKARLKDTKLQLGDVTTINLTQLQGGILSNVIPSELKVCFDIRLDNNKDHKEFEEMINGWCKEAGEGVCIEFIEKNDKIESTVLDDNNKYWKTFESVCKKLGIDLQIGIFPGGTDSRYVRAMGIPAIGFSPMNNTKILLHDHDEHLNKKVFLKGIETYMEFLTALGNLN